MGNKSSSSTKEQTQTDSSDVSSAEPPADASDKSKGKMLFVKVITIAGDSFQIEVGANDKVEKVSSAQ